MNKFVSIVAIFISIIGFSESIAWPQSLSQPLYLIRYRSVGWNITVNLNQVPVLRRDKGGGQLPIGNLIVNGTNKIELNAKQLIDDADPLDVSLVYVKPSGDELVLTRWAEPPSKSNLAPIRREKDFQIQLPIVRVWENAPSVRSLSSDDERLIFELVQKLADAFKTKNLTLHDNLRALYFQEEAKESGSTPAQVQVSNDEVLSRMFKSGTFDVQLRDRDRLEIRPYGRIVLVSAKASWPEDWVVLLRSDGQQFSLRDLLLSKIDGQWRLIN